MGNEISVKLYCPRSEQRKLHDSLKRFNCLVAHRRFGKTVFCINEMIARSVLNKKKEPRYAYIAPTFTQAKDVAWSYLKRYTQAIPSMTSNESELRVDLPGGRRIRLYGAESADRLRGLYFDGVVLDEFAQIPPSTWREIILPALTDRQGWALFIGTPKGRNHFADLYDEFTRRMSDGDPDYFAALRPVSQTKLLPQEELSRARSQMTEAEYAQEFECSFQAAIVGAYYGPQMERAVNEGRIIGVPYDPRYPVHTAWDLGIDDATAIWFCQIVGYEIRLIGYYQASGVGLEHYASMLRERGYSYGTHLLPHDVEVREMGTGQTRLEMLRSLGIKATVVPMQKVEDGINAVRSILSRCVFDAVKCKDGVEALRQYTRDWDEINQVFKPRPRHDRWSHGADAMRYLALGMHKLEAETASFWTGERAAYRPTDGGLSSYDPLAI